MRSGFCSPIILDQEMPWIRRSTLLPICHMLCTTKLPLPRKAADFDPQQATLALAAVDRMLARNFETRRVHAVGKEA